jgi:hypothetical protein
MDEQMPIFGDTQAALKKQQLLTFATHINAFVYEQCKLAP